eukprot:8353770-Lingulodinium_polyedra.AAC.1
MHTPRARDSLRRACGVCVGVARARAQVCARARGVAARVGPCEVLVNVTKRCDHPCVPALCACVQSTTANAPRARAPRVGAS